MGIQATVNAQMESDKWKKVVAREPLILATQLAKVIHSNLDFDKSKLSNLKG